MSILGLLIILFLIPVLFVIISVVSLLFRVLKVFHKKEPKSNKKKNTPHYDFDERDDFIYLRIEEIIEDRKSRGLKMIGDEVGEYVDYEDIN